MHEPVVDQQLVREALAGSRPSVDALVDLVRARVYAYLCHTTLDAHTAEDLTHDTIVAMLRSMGRLREADRFWPWVLTIASNSAKQQYRAQTAARRAHARIIARQRRQAAATQPPRPTESSDELYDATLQAIERMPTRIRTVLALRLYRRMPYAQIADLLDCSPMAARVAFVRAKRWLRQALQASPETGAASAAPSPGHIPRSILAPHLLALSTH